MFRKESLWAFWGVDVGYLGLWLMKPTQRRPLFPSQYEKNFNNSSCAALPLSIANSISNAAFLGL